MRENSITEKAILTKLIMILAISLSVYLLAGCTSSNTCISTTKLAADCNNDYIYFYRYDDTSAGNQNEKFNLIQYNTQTGEEKKIATTNALVGLRIYNNRIYYFDENSYNLYSINEKNLKLNMEYDTQDSLPKNDYIDLGSKFVYLDSGKLNIKEKNEQHQIETVWNFNVYKNQIYYVDVNIADENDWSIKKLKNNFEAETILSLEEIKKSFDDAFKEHGQIDNISIYHDKLYFTVGEYPITSHLRLYCFDLKNRDLNRVTEEYIYEYQATDNEVYCLVEDRVLKKYSNNTYETIFEDIYSFKVTNDNQLMYMKSGDNTLYIKTDDKDISIPNVLS